MKIVKFFIWLVGPIMRFITWHVVKKCKCGGCGKVIKRSEATNFGCSNCFWKAMKEVKRGLDENRIPRR